MNNFSDYSWHADPEPGPLADGEVRGIAGRIAGNMIEVARTSDEPVAWVTGNSYLPALRSYTEAERVWQAENNADGELFSFLAEEIESHLSRAEVLLEGPEYDNALYVVDLRRWEPREIATEDDLNDKWEPVTHFSRGPEPSAMSDR